MGAKVTRWIIFTILFSLVPIAASYIAAAKNSVNLPPLSSAIEHGELYLLSSSFAAVGLGEVIIGVQRLQIARLIVSGLSIIEIALSALLFSLSNNSVDSMSKAYWANISYPIFVFTCIIGTSCIIISEIKDA